MEIQGEVPGHRVIAPDVLQNSLRGDGVGELCGRRVRRVPRTGHVVLADEIEVETQARHEQIKAWVRPTDQHGISGLPDGKLPAAGRERPDRVNVVLNMLT